MEIEIRVLIVLAMLICLSSSAHAAQGTATFYTQYVPSACYGYQNNGVNIAAASNVFWKNGAACGKRYKITCLGPTNQGVPHPCTGKTVVVKIVDYCPPGCAGTIDLSKEAFSTIANTDAGKINIQYTQ
ncbi:Expansin [Parasponia andersonii]|uniref:Expansin n=1 Tax=Parasponia andersonii TaxID=3476 RepID=A0A2P5C4M4_PARAD|nr:Expansin [Parasponia andersonii]